jgi:hypothetical protein
MKKLYLFMVLAVLTGAGYLTYDWHTAIRDRKQPPKVVFYAWTDAEGVRHFTDTAPPAGARNVEKGTGVAPPREPLVFRMKRAVVDAWNGLRSKFTDDPGKPKKYKRLL